VKKFKTILSNPTQTTPSRNYKIQFHQNITMRQDFNPCPCSWSCFGHVRDKEVYFLQQNWARLVEMTESEGEKKNGKCFHEKLGSK